MMLVIIVGIACMGASGAEAKPADGFPAMKELPNPFLMNSGKCVATIEEWRQRREEIRELVLKYQYGHVPPSPGNVVLYSERKPQVLNDGRTLFRHIRLKMGPGQKLRMRLYLYLPQEVTGPCPTVLRVGLDAGPSRQINERGCIYACYQHQDLDPDREGRDVVGPAQKAYPDYDWGDIAVWAWGASRALDFLLTLPEVHPDQVIVTGHSRAGKTALLAGALDERFAMVVPNGSGCGGAGCYRILGPDCETLEAITLPERWQSWFQKDFGRFSRKEEHLPFDQHFVKALVAPRLLLSTDGTGDTWANPLGTQATYLAVQPVYDFLGASENNALHFRQGGHDQLPEDFSALLDFADKHFRAKAITRKFNVLPFTDYSWECPWQLPPKAEQRATGMALIDE